MAIKNKKSGFALLAAVVVMSVMLSFGLSLGSLAYKQQVLSSGAIESLYAFYAADSALECALYADQQQNLFDYASYSVILHPNLITLVTCNGAGMSASEIGYVWNATRMEVTQRVSLGAQSCADVTIYKYPSGETHVFSQGYNVSCATVASPGGARIVSRGIYARY